MFLVKKANLLMALGSLLLACACGGQGKQGKETMADSVGQQLVGADRDEHGCLPSAGYTWSEVRRDCIRLFEEGIRLEDTAGNTCFIVFGPDSAQAELFFNHGDKSEILDRRILPRGDFAWNVEDDDTKNLRRENGKWIIRQRTKIIYTEVEANREATLGKRQHLVYTGTSSGTEASVYTLQIISREHSGDGRFIMTRVTTDEKTGVKKKKSYEGKRFTLRGISGDNDAMVWQLVSDDKMVKFNFLREDDNTLVLLDEDFKRNESVVKVVLKRME